MATGEDLKKITNARLKAVKSLKESGDYDTAYYIIGYALECALKSVICKTLNFDNYPDMDGMGKKVETFKTHSFDLLLALSGMEKDFTLNAPAERAYNWSQFTKAWVIDSRYQPIGIRTKEEIERMIKMLEENENGILYWIEEKQKW